MNSLSRPMLAAVTFAIGLIVGWLGGGALRKGGLPSPTVIDTAKPESAQTVGAVAKSQQPKAPGETQEFHDMKKLSLSLLSDESLEDGPNALYFDFVTKSANLHSTELISLLEETIKLFTDENSETATEHGSMAAIGCLIQRLATADPKAAGEWISRHQDIQSEEDIVDNALKIIQEKDPAYFATLAAGVKDEQFKGRLELIRLNVDGQKNPLAALTEIMQRSEKVNDNGPQEFDSIVPELLTRLAKQQPSEAASAAMKMESSGKFSGALMENVMAQWVKVDPVAATQWTLAQKGEQAIQASQARLSTEASQADVRMISQAMKSWTDVEAVISRTPQQQDTLDALVRGIVVHLKNENENDLTPAKAWASELTEPALKAAANTAVTLLWVEQDPVGASEHIANLPDSMEKNQGIEALVNSIISTDPERAFAWASKVTSADTKDQLMTESMRAWLDADPIAAARMLEQLPPEFRESVNPNSSK